MRIKSFRFRSTWHSAIGTAANVFRMIGLLEAASRSTDGRRQRNAQQICLKRYQKREMMLIVKDTCIRCCRKWIFTWCCSNNKLDKLLRRSKWLFHWENMPKEKATPIRMSSFATVGRPRISWRPKQQCVNRMTPVYRLFTHIEFIQETFWFFWLYCFYMEAVLIMATLPSCVFSSNAWFEIIECITGWP
jgi:hypothetical protein